MQTHPKLWHKLRCGRQHMKPFSALATAYSLVLGVVLSVIIILPAWQHRNHQQATQRQFEQQKKSCLQQQNKQQLTILKLYQLTHQINDNPLAQSMPIDWQRDLLYWLKQHNFHITQFERVQSDAPSPQYLYQLNAHSSWPSFVTLFNQLQYLLPKLHIQQFKLQTNPDKANDLLITLQLQVNHE